MPWTFLFECILKHILIRTFVPLFPLQNHITPIPFLFFARPLPICTITILFHQITYRIISLPLLYPMIILFPLLLFRILLLHLLHLRILMFQIILYLPPSLQPPFRCIPILTHPSKHHTHSPDDCRLYCLLKTYPSWLGKATRVLGIRLSPTLLSISSSSATSQMILTPQYDPDLIPSFPPIIHPNSPMVDRDKYTHWWSMDGIASHILCSTIDMAILNSLPMPNIHLGERRTACNVYAFLRQHYGSGDYNSVTNIEAKLKNSLLW